MAAGGSEKVGEIYVDIRARDSGLTAQLNTAQNTVTGFSRRVTGLLAPLRSLQRALFAVTGTVGLATTAFVGLLSAMGRLATLGERTKEQIDALTAAFKAGEAAANGYYEALRRAYGVDTSPFEAAKDAAVERLQAEKEIVNVLVEQRQISSDTAFDMRRAAEAAYRLTRDTLEADRERKEFWEEAARLIDEATKKFRDEAAAQREELDALREWSRRETERRTEAADRFRETEREFQRFVAESIATFRKAMTDAISGAAGDLRAASRAHQDSLSISLGRLVQLAERDQLTRRR